VKTGDGPTEDAGGATRNEENVIRLPRDWLGPPEELVPIGPAARARAAQLEADAPPPAADAFWSEDSAALHDAVQAPVGTERQPSGPPVGLVAPVAGRWRFRLPGPRRGRLPGRRIRWALVALPAVALLVMAAIGLSEQGAPGVATSHTRASSRVNRTASTLQVNTAAASADAAREKAAALKRHPAPQTAARRHAHAKEPSTSARAQRHVSRVHHAPAAPTPTVTEPVSSPQTSSSASSVGATSHTTYTPTAATTPVSDTASKPSSGGSSSAPPPGPTGIGSVSGGCSVKCS
jgi:hypothetical protein